MATSVKVPYVCGPLTELPAEIQQQTKELYCKIADVCESSLGVRAFVPHEHYDPIKHADFTPWQVDAAERYQVSEKTSVLIVMAIAPSWGGGIEVEIANKSGVCVVIYHPADKKVSRLLRGNPAVIGTFSYQNEEQMLGFLEQQLWNLRTRKIA